MQNPSEFTVLSTSRDKVYVVAESDPGKATEKLKHELDWEETHPDQRLYVDGTLDSFLEDTNTDGFALLNP